MIDDEMSILMFSDHYSLPSPKFFYKNNKGKNVVYKRCDEFGSIQGSLVENQL